jgi:hypothetical protein
MRRCVVGVGNAVDLISTTGRERAALENIIDLLCSVMHKLLAKMRSMLRLSLESIKGVRCKG